MNSENKITAGELIGHRIWRVGLDDNELMSVCMCNEWHDGVMSAPSVPVNPEILEFAREEYLEKYRTGVSGRDLIGDLRIAYCNSGIHSFKERKDAIGYARDMYFFGGHVRLVIGTIEMWGIVWEHEKGYRAQYARVKSLEKNYDPLERLDITALRAKYNIVAQNSEGNSHEQRKSDHAG